MKYDDNIERSAELLRAAVPLMSRQSAGLHPVSYAVWYEYVAQNNAALRAAVDEHMRRAGSLDNATAHAMYREHIAPEIDPARILKVSEGVQRVLAGMTESAEQAGRQTERFGDSLSRLTEHLERGSETSAVDEALSSTREMQQAVAHLRARLDASRQEVETLRQEVMRARQESMLDPLTGLANRRAFDQRLAACLAAQDALGDAPRPCLVIADIDHFKRINDSFGHAFGDQVLRALAQVMQQVAPQAELAARTGGEEFALLLPAMPLADAEQVADRVRRTIGAARVRRAEQVLERVTISLGVTTYRRGDTADSFFERADGALYDAKNGGRDRVCVRVE